MSEGYSTLDPLLSPRSIALVGASENAARIGGRPLRYLSEGGYKGKVFPVNPNRTSVQGYTAYPSVSSLPETPDVAILAVPASSTLQALKECADRGVKSAIIFSAGFAETGEGGRALQSEISSIAREAKMRVLGPNCLGVFNVPAGYYGTFSAVLDAEYINPGPVAIVSQSGAYGSHLAHLARQRGLGLSHWITTGNECDIDVAEALEWVVSQTATKVVMAYAEGIRNGDAFLKALSVARDLHKPVVFMKVGRSEVGALAASSHTAALAGSDAIFDAVFRQYGVYRAKTTAEQVDVAYACARGVYPINDKIGIFTLSGGFGIQMADDASAAGLDVAAMPEAAQDELKAMLPYASPRNPVDATAQAVTDLPLMTRYIHAVLERGGYGMFAGIFGSGPSSPTFAAPLRQALEDATSGQRNCVLSLTMSAPTEIIRSYEARGFLVFEDGTALINALGALVYFRRVFESRTPANIRPGEYAPIKVDERQISEVKAKSILSKAGISFPTEALVQAHEDPAEIAEKVGLPVVLKICSPDIAHKTEVGGVLVGVASKEDVRRGARAILENVRKLRPDARVEGILISPMITGGVETIVGVVRDATFGPVVMFGLGGIFVEVLKDVTFRVAPFDEREARSMVEEVRGRAILEGVRGRPASDVAALAKMLSSLSRFAAANADVIETIDLNPVLAMPKGRGALPLDALLEFRTASA